MTKKTKITRLYTGDDAQSHFENIEIAMEDNIVGHISKTYGANGIVFRETSESYDYDFHVAPARQYVVNLEGAVEITVRSGEKRVFEAGEVFICEDTTGQGHISRAVNGQVRRSLFITLGEIEIAR